LNEVLTVADIGHGVMAEFLARLDLELILQPKDEAIIGSFWGDAEAGVVGHSVYVRPNTPIHSFLHESCHVICMDGERRSRLDQDAGGDDLEEAAVCYLQMTWMPGATVFASAALVRGSKTMPMMLRNFF
jgi:hypothetical protein